MAEDKCPLETELGKIGFASLRVGLQPLGKLLRDAAVVACQELKNEECGEKFVKALADASKLLHESKPKDKPDEKAKPKTPKKAEKAETKKKE